MLPATIQGIRRYLGSGLIKGIGPNLAERIVDRFDIETPHVIEEQSQRLIEAPGLGPKRTAMIAAAWEEEKASWRSWSSSKASASRPRWRSGYFHTIPALQHDAAATIAGLVAGTPAVAGVYG